MSDDDFREKLYTIGKRGERHWVYPQLVFGKYFRARSLVIVFLMAVYLLLPWIQVGGSQSVYLDIINRKFTFFGATFWATDAQFLLFVLTLLALSLFFFTALFGRVWCGWACPETVFLEFLYRPIERLIEGNAAARMRLDRQPWNFEKIRKKSLKYLSFIIVSWILASTLLAYFVGQERLIQMMQNPPTDNLPTFLMTVLLMAVLLFQFGWFREQFCTVLCPYARFQSVLIDQNSLIVGYDPIRGEPRGKGKRTEKNKHLGDCVDCGLCVRVCPTGIDIRNGLQLECIQCAACIDACDSIMRSVGKPEGLIRYDAESAFLSGKGLQWIRPRVVFYAVLLLIAGCVFAYHLSSRSLTELQIIRAQPQKPFSILESGLIANQFRIHLTNKGKASQQYRISQQADNRITLITPLSSMQIAGDSIQTIPLFVHFPENILKNGKFELEVTIESAGDFQEIHRFTLLGPEQ